MSAAELVIEADDAEPSAAPSVALAPEAAAPSTAAPSSAEARAGIGAASVEITRHSTAQTSQLKNWLLTTCRLKMLASVRMDFLGAYGSWLLMIAP